jgi:alkylation response protein AidB-like acyl-CoA dehydrogenase
MMELMPSPAQQDIADSTAEYLAKEFPISRVRELATADGCAVVDENTWRRWAALGFFSLGLPEHAGGLGLGLVEELLVIEQFGRYLTPGPTVSSIVATHVAHAAGLRKLTSALVGGAVQIGLRIGDIGYDVQAGGLALSVNRTGAELHAISEATALQSIDPSMRLSRVVVGDRIAAVADEMVQLRLWVLQSAMLVGIAAVAEAQSTAYAKVRHQFGQPIGAFQAVKHRCADMAVRSYVASAQLHLAATSVDTAQPDARFQSAAALTLALDAARSNVAVNIQNHGGIGFTDEHDAGLMLKRATALAAAVGSDSDRLDAMTTPSPTLFT